MTLTLNNPRRLICHKIKKPNPISSYVCFFTFLPSLFCLFLAGFFFFQLNYVFLNLYRYVYFFFFYSFHFLSLSPLVNFISFYPSVPLIIFFLDCIFIFLFLVQFLSLPFLSTTFRFFSRIHFYFFYITICLDYFPNLSFSFPFSYSNFHFSPFSSFPISSQLVLLRSWCISHVNI